MKRTRLSDAKDSRQIRSVEIEDIDPPKKSMFTFDFCRSSEKKENKREIEKVTKSSLATPLRTSKRNENKGEIEKVTKSSTSPLRTPKRNKNKGKIEKVAKSTIAPSLISNITTKRESTVVQHNKPAKKLKIDNSQLKIVEKSSTTQPSHPNRIFKRKTKGAAEDKEEILTNKEKYSIETKKVPKVPKRNQTPITDTEQQTSDKSRPLKELFIDQNENEFNSILNSEVSGNRVMVGEEYLKSCAGFMEPDGIKFKPAYPGVGCATIDSTGGSTTGYMQITPRTLKPLEMSKQSSIIYWILNGEVIVRSSAFTVGDNGKSFLYGKKLGTGSCVVIPSFTPYTIENRSHHTPALLGFVFLMS